MIKNYFIYITKYKDINIKIKTKKCPILFIINNKYFHGPSLHTYFKSPNISGPSLLFSEFVMVRVCYGPSCPVTVMISVRNGKRVKFRPQEKKTQTCHNYFSYQNKRY